MEDILPLNTFNVAPVDHLLSFSSIYLQALGICYDSTFSLREILVNAIIVTELSHFSQCTRAWCEAHPLDKRLNEGFKAN